MKASRRAGRAGAGSEQPTANNAPVRASHKQDNLIVFSGFDVHTMEAGPSRTVRAPPVKRAIRKTLPALTVSSPRSTLAGSAENFSAGALTYDAPALQSPPPPLPM